MSEENKEVVQTEAAPEAAPEKEVAKDSPAEPAVAAAPEYVPNYKFKAYDKEYDFPEYVRGVIKSKELEEKLRADYAKAYAHDELREKYTKVQPYREKYEQIEQNINKLEKHLNEGDVENFFVGLGYKPQQVEQMLSKYVLDKLNYRELPEDQRRAFDEAKNARKQASEYEEKYGKLQSELDEYKIRQLDTELTVTLSDPSIADLARTWDERVGRPGAFREEVILRGDRLSRQSGRTATPQEAASEFAAYARSVLGTAQQMPYQQPVAKPKPTLPNVNNKSASSPAGKKFKRLEDLEKYVEERFGAN